MPPAPEAGPSTGCAPPLEVPACARRVTATEVACLVHAYLQGEGYHRATEGFKADAASVLAPVFAVRPPTLLTQRTGCSATAAGRTQRHARPRFGGVSFLRTGKGCEVGTNNAPSRPLPPSLPPAQAGAPPSVRPLADVLTHYLHLLERESARQACCAGSKLARTLLEVFESHAGAAPLRHLEPLVVLPGFAQPHPAAVPPPPHPLVFAVPPAPARPTFPVHQAPPAAPTRSPHGGRKPPAPRKRAAPGGGGGAARSVRPAMDRAAAGAVAALPFPPGSFQALLMNGSGQMDPAGFADLINGDDERLLVLGEALAAPLPHLDDLEVRALGALTRRRLTRAARPAVLSAPARHGWRRTRSALLRCRSLRSSARAHLRQRRRVQASHRRHPQGIRQRPSGAGGALPARG